ncbi:MAG: acyltransferase [Akkermansiaceae bacterium]|nr:acyltransferase [Verrucomicrobiales bacterium]
MEQKSYIPQLTGVRAMAAFMVYLHNIPMTGVAVPAWLQSLFTELHIGVTIFFVLSGFLIYWNYYDVAKLTRAWWSRYTNNRVARLYPLYFIVTCITLVVQVDIDSVSWFLNLTFVKGFSNFWKFGGVAQGWSLTPEWTFYVMAPLLFTAIRRYGFLIPLAMVYLLGGILMLIGYLVNYMQFFEGAAFMTGYTFFGRAFEFFAGMYLARYLARPGSEAPRSNGSWMTWISLGMMAMSVYVMTLYRTEGYYYGVDHPVGRALNNLVLPMVIAYLFLGLIREKSLVRNILGSRLVSFLGKASYAFYLIHMGVIQTFISQHTPGQGLTHYFLVFLGVNLVAVGLYFLFELPLNKWMRRRLMSSTEKAQDRIAPPDLTARPQSTPAA